MEYQSNIRVTFGVRCLQFKGVSKLLYYIQDTVTVDYLYVAAGCSRNFPLIKFHDEVGPARAYKGETNLFNSFRIASNRFCMLTYCFCSRPILYS